MNDHYLKIREKKKQFTVLSLTLVVMISLLTGIGYLLYVDKGVKKDLRAIMMILEAFNLLFVLILVAKLANKFFVESKDNISIKGQGGQQPGCK